MVVIVVMAAAGAVHVMLVIVVMVVAAAGAVLIVLMVIMVVMMVLMVMLVVVLMLHVLQLFVQRVVLHRLDYLIAAELVPRGADKSGLGVELLEKLGRSEDLFRARGVGTAHDDEVGVLDLIIEKLAEVAHVHAALARIDDCDSCADVCALDLLHCMRHVAELADAGRLDDDTVRSILVHDLLECLRKVTDQRAADAAGIHFGYLNTCVLEKAAVNGDLAEFVLDKNELFVFVALGYQLADERSFARAEKT